MLKMISGKIYLLKVKNGNGVINKNIANEIVISLRLQASGLLKTFKWSQLKFKSSFIKLWLAIRDL